MFSQAFDPQSEIEATFLESECSAAPHIAFFGIEWKVNAVLSCHLVTHGIVPLGAFGPLCFHLISTIDEGDGKEVSPLL